MVNQSQSARPEDGCAWVTGASSGIGRDVALRLAKEGWIVVATARSEKALTKLTEEAAALKGSIVAAPGDVSDREKMADIVAQIEAEIAPLALAILNAGVFLPVDTLNLDLDKFDLSIEVNLKGTVNCISPVIHAFRSRSSGQIAIVSSVTGYGGLPTSAAYGATKAGLINLAECMAIELEPHGIRTNIVNPGFVKTPAQDGLEFQKPFIVSSEVAAKRIIDGLKRDKFEITFPRRFTFVLKLLNNFIPKGTYLRLVRKQTLRSHPSD
jgi:NAD(P)-dependent dehydrogenase (short-subunit alcohol dehydrogenase family)